MLTPVMHRQPMTRKPITYFVYFTHYKKLGYWGTTPLTECQWCSTATPDCL